MTLSDFQSWCDEAFASLVRDHGFAPSQFEQIGHEHYVRFHREARTLSIVVAPGAPPLVELFHPPGPDEKPVPWAAKDGVARARRIPRLDVPSTSDTRAFLHSLAERFEANEHDWLRG